MEPIAHIYTDFSSKFGIPRQSGLVEELCGQIIFCPKYRNPDCLRGLSDFTYIWLLWQFSGNQMHRWQPTVRPPRLGGNTPMGVFATRSPFRPNGIGLSSVKIDKIEFGGVNGPVIHVFGADIMNGTPIFDIKPYITYTDSHPEARSGFVDNIENKLLNVIIDNELLSLIPDIKRQSLIKILELDPRPSYQNDQDKIYGVTFAGFNIRFSVKENNLYVVDVQPEYEDNSH